ncbi:MAG: hypothetical protein HY831_04945 [Candidatus Aenigmarchaeota archaeon]|nr:hypothetical protein [Candidatus Aenigmarchaeota archaeon]
MQKYLDQCSKTQTPLDIKIEDDGFALGKIVGCPAIKEVYQLVLFTIIIGIILFSIGLYEQYRYETRL